MMSWFRLQTPQITYGRLALIHCDGKPAIELLEIVAPESAEQPVYVYARLLRVAPPSASGRKRKQRRVATILLAR